MSDETGHEQRMAELRGILSAPGWATMVEILTQRRELVQRLMMVPPDLRPKGMGDERLRGEYLILTLLLTKPLELLAAYDSVVRDASKIDPYGEWVNKALETGMSHAGFPRANPEEDGD